MVSVSCGPYGVHIHPAADDVPGLTQEEKKHLDAVRKKAQEFEIVEVNRMRSVYEGKLYKFTNLVKGWQYRWFVLTPETGMLEYYMLDEVKKSKPRGGIHLSGAAISPSEDDSYSFIVSAVCGEVYKLKATDANERLHWVNRLRAVAEFHSGSPVRSTASGSKGHHHHHHSSSPSHRDFPITERSPKTSESGDSKPKTEGSLKEKKHDADTKLLIPTDSIPTLSESLSSIKICVSQAAASQKDLALMIEDCPLDGANVKCSDTDLLLLKATSQALVQSLEHCYLILLQRQMAMLKPKGLPPGAAVEWIDTSKS